MKVNQKMSRRKFLKAGLVGTATLALFPLLKSERKEPAPNRLQPRRARHYRHLAG